MLHFFWQSIGPKVMPGIAHIGPNCIASNPVLGFFDTKTIWPGQIYQVAHPRAKCNRCHHAGMKTSCPRVVTSSMGQKTGKVCHCMPNGGAYTPLAFSYSTIIIPFKILLLLTLPKPNAEVSLKLLNGKRPGEIYQGIHPCTRCNMTPIKLAKKTIITKPLIPKLINPPKHGHVSITRGGPPLVPPAKN